MPLAVFLVTATLAVLWYCWISALCLPQLATVRASGPPATSGQRNVGYLTQEFTIHAANATRPGGPPSSRQARGRYRDPLRHHRAVVGRDTRTPWYIRVRSIIVLFLIVVALGMAIAGVTLLIIASGRFLLEILAG